MDADAIPIYMRISDKEMREARITEEDIDEAVSDVRSGRSSRAGKGETAVVTITAR